ncbi:MAG: glycosyltransferase [Bacteroidales bacterium]|nr:glycosyltransferase [Bacteroidales bacterium]
MILLIGTIILLYAYIILILFALRGWAKKDCPCNFDHSFPFCSVVIAARNESDNIENTISYLLSQHYPAECFEILVIDDHSTDNTLEILKKTELQHKNLHVVSAPDDCIGKKQSLRHVLQLAKGDLILFTDADCIVNENWIETYVAFANEHKGNLSFGNVIPKIDSTSSLVEKCVALDFIGILGVQNGLANSHHAFSCNGANMCITKSFYQKAYETNESFASGDDVFLLHTAKRIDKNAVFFIPDTNAAIKTSVPSTLKAFFDQRIRWASKAGGYKDFTAILVALIVYIYCMAMAICAVGACLGSVLCFVAFSLLFVSKLCIDLILFIVTEKHFESKKYLWLALPFECVYFLYIIIIPILSFFKKTKWKEREI